MRFTPFMFLARLSSSSWCRRYIAVSRNFAQINFGIEIRGKGIAVIPAVAVEDIDRFNGIKIVLLRIGAENLRYARVKTGPQQGADAGIFIFFEVVPLVRIIEISGKSFLLYALFVVCAPYGIIRVFTFIIRRIDIMNFGLQTGFHDRKILIGQGHVQYGDGFKLIDQSYQLFHAVGIDFGGRELCLCFILYFFDQLRAFAFRAAGNENIRENIIGLRTFLDGDLRDAAASDY